jgi:Protein of unknown function (DUF2851)
MSYRDLRHSVWGASLQESPALPLLPSELELQALWFSGAFGRDFTATDGQPVRIVQFGEWNRSAGPDFLRATVKVGCSRHEGALEIDTRASDWEAHGHGADPAFSGVVLHVVFSDSGPQSFTRTCEHRAVPRVVLPADLVQEALNLPMRQVAIARPGRCVRPLANLPTGEISSLLKEAAIYRAYQKAQRFLKISEVHGEDEALFQVTAETLGYRSNALPMRLLTQRLPLRHLRQGELDRSAILFGTAGFLHPDQHEKAPDDTKEYLRTLWDTWWKVRGPYESIHPLPWKMQGQRPANHPHRRIAALAALCAKWTTYRRLALGKVLDLKLLTDFLTGLSDPFWSHRHTLQSARSKEELALFGTSKVQELLANHLYPLHLHQGGDPETYLQLRAPAPNESVKRAAIRLFGSQQAASPWLKKAAHHQALIQIYHDFCLEDSSDCADCPFPEQLAQWRQSDSFS